MITWYSEPLILTHDFHFHLEDAIYAMIVDATIGITVVIPIYGQRPQSQLWRHYVILVIVISHQSWRHRWFRHC
jgi:hypothetical protein